MTTPPSTDILSQIDAILVRTERIFGAAKWLIGLVVAGVLLVARLEWANANHEHRLGGLEGDVKNHGLQIERIKGQMGYATSATPPPDNRPPIVWHPDKRAESENRP